MARIACFIDDTDIAYAVQHQLYGSGHEWCFFSASCLTNAIRTRVQAFAPDCVLLELTPITDNAHLFFFLRADMTTRESPVVFLSESANIEQQMLMLDADGSMHHPFSADQFWSVVVDLVPLEHAVAA